MNKTRSIENLHILLWILKDTSWLHSWKLLGCVIIAPTVLVQCFITWSNRKDFGELFHNAAIILWLVANSIWMVGEFFYDDTTRPYAAWFFDAGLLLIALYYLSVFRNRKMFGKRRPPGA